MLYPLKTAPELCSLGRHLQDFSITDPALFRAGAYLPKTSSLCQIGPRWLFYQQGQHPSYNLMKIPNYGETLNYYRPLVFRVAETETRNNFCPHCPDYTNGTLPRTCRAIAFNRIHRSLSACLPLRCALWSASDLNQRFRSIVIPRRPSHTPVNYSHFLCKTGSLLHSFASKTSSCTIYFLSFILPSFR